MKFLVRARRYWDDSHIVLQSGKTYRVAPVGRMKWLNSNIKCGPDGYVKWRVSLFRELLHVTRLVEKTCRFFELIGTLGRRYEDAFPIGFGTEITLTRTDVLFAFANDAPGFHCNNHKGIWIEVIEMPDGNWGYSQ